MPTITLHAHINERHQIILDVPDDLPIGEVEITIRPIARPANELTHEEMDQRLRAAGLLVEFSEDDPDWLELADVPELTDDELDELMEQTKGGTSLLDMINQDRGAW